MLDINKVVVFQVGNEEYAISIDSVISIEKIEGITPIPHLPNYVKGIMKVRNELIPVIDFENILYHRFSNVNETARMIVIQTDELSFGAIVGEAREIIDISPDCIKQVGLVAYQKTNYFSGVANLSSRLITLIDPFVLVQSLEGIKEIQEFLKNQKSNI